jgi:hypothetical protein
MAIKVEVGFDLTESSLNLFFTLDDPTRGQLDNVGFPLAGTVFFDITQYVESVAIQRGKSRLLDRFQAGRATVVLNNTGREFDPTYTASPFFGNIIPRRAIRIAAEDEFQFVGVIDDWNLNFEPQGKQTAVALASDGFTKLANQKIDAFSASEQKSGERIASILNRDEIAWPFEQRQVDTGEQTLSAQSIEAETGALSYLQLVEQSEPGRLFIAKNGDLIFKSRIVAPTTDTLLTLSDDGSGIPFQDVSVEYGSELLYNQVLIGGSFAGGTAIANNTNSQEEYGVTTLAQTNLLLNSVPAAQELADYYAEKFSEPEFRFDRIRIRLDRLTPSQRAEILGLELGSVVSVEFTPIIPPAIQKFAEVIGIRHNIQVQNHDVELSFSTLDFASLVLDDLAFGKLDAGNALAF